MPQTTLAVGGGAPATASGGAAWEDKQTRTLSSGLYHRTRAVCPTGLAGVTGGDSRKGFPSLFIHLHGPVYGHSQPCFLFQLVAQISVVDLPLWGDYPYLDLALGTWRSPSAMTAPPKESEL